METTKHTPEPWTIEDRRGAALRNIRIVAGLHWIATVEDVHQRDYQGGYSLSDVQAADAIDALGFANGARIVACVNACSGIADPADLRKQRDDLLAACRAEHASQGGPQLLRDAADDLTTLKLLGAASALRVMADQIEAAIAKAEGKEKP
jgi:hypothetical protein